MQHLAAELIAVRGSFLGLLVRHKKIYQAFFDYLVLKYILPLSWTAAQDKACQNKDDGEATAENSQLTKGLLH